MKETKLICINCPIGCNLKVLQNSEGKITSIEGNKCPKGKDYAQTEVIAPVRMLTSSVAVTGSKEGAVLVSCKTAKPIPKGKMAEAAKALVGVSVSAPVKIGDVIIGDIAGTGISIVATKNVN